MLRQQMINDVFSIDIAGVNGGIIVPNSPSLNPTSCVLISFRVFLKAGVPCNLADNSQSGVTNSYYCYVDGAGYLYWYSTISGVPRNILAAKAPYRHNDWNDYDFYYSGSRVEIYANKELVATLDCSGALGTNSQAVRFGQYYTGAVNSQCLFNTIKVYITDKFTLKDHIARCSNKRLPKEIETTCVLDLDPNTGAGTTVYDRSGQGNHGTFTRNVWSTTVPFKFRSRSTGRGRVSGRVMASGKTRPLEPNDPANIYAIIASTPITLEGWYRGDKVTGLADGSLVSSWEDQSGLGNHLPASGALRPTFYKETAAQLLNGYPTLAFNGSNYLRLASGFTAGPRTVFIVARSFTEPLLQGFFDGATPLTGAIYRLSNNHRVYAGAAIGFIPGLGSAYKIMSGVFDGQRSVCGLGPVEVQGNSGTNTSTGITVGGIADNTGLLNGNIAEVLVFKGPMSEFQRRQVRVYLSAKYNI